MKIKDLQKPEKCKIIISVLVAFAVLAVIIIAVSAPEQPIIDFEGLSAVNSDVVGWIRFDETVIDYPIAQCGNNDYYLEHLFNKEENSSGCIFLDCRNNSDFSDRNSV